MEELTEVRTLPATEGLEKSTFFNILVRQSGVRCTARLIQGALALH